MSTCQVVSRQPSSLTARVSGVGKYTFSETIRTARKNDAHSTQKREAFESERTHFRKVISEESGSTRERRRVTHM